MATTGHTDRTAVVLQRPLDSRIWSGLERSRRPHDPLFQPLFFQWTATAEPNCDLRGSMPCWGVLTMERGKGKLLAYWGAYHTQGPDMRQCQEHTMPGMDLREHAREVFPIIQRRLHISGPKDLGGGQDEWPAKQTGHWAHASPGLALEPHSGSCLSVNCAWLSSQPRPGICTQFPLYPRCLQTPCGCHGTRSSPASPWAGQGRAGHFLQDPKHLPVCTLLKWK